VASFDVPRTGLAPDEATADSSVSEENPQAAAAAEIIQEARPDILLLTGLDAGTDGAAVAAFQQVYLAVGHRDAEPIDYPYLFTAPVNSDPEQGMVLLSLYPIVTDQVRTFQNLPWSMVPDTRLPDDPITSQPPDELATMPLSSTSLWDIPVDVDGAVLHVLATRATEPVDEATAARNADEIGFWAHYVAGDDTSWIVDDTGTTGGLPADAEFVIVGNLNADPTDGPSVPGAMQQLFDIERIQDPHPTSDGAAEAAETQGGANTTQQGDPATDTADLTDDPAPGNLRLDYVLASGGLDSPAAGVWWPPTDHELAHLAGDSGTEHHLVWVDLR
jgi:hypothetical protein